MSAKGRAGKLMGWAEWAAVGATVIIALTIAAILSPGFRSLIASGSTAAWVQALGSIGAILGAVWISNRDRTQQISEAEHKDELLQEQVGFEVSNLAYDVLQFLARTSNTDITKRPRYLVDEAEFNELLERMAWVRRVAKNAIDLEDVRNLRENLVETTAILRVNAQWDRSIPEDEQNDMLRWQRECRDISNRRMNERGKHLGLTAPPT
ncbi:hypothetical protein G5B41_17570 [bacterium SGD-2]|nr:hypothetical protein [bacterium SGD-2]